MDINEDVARIAHLGLIDEYQLCIHPVIEGGGFPLFEAIMHPVKPSLQRTLTVGCGAIVL